MNWYSDKTIKIDYNPVTLSESLAVNQVGSAPWIEFEEIPATIEDANCIFVDKTGDDSTGDGSRDLPYLTIGKAVDVLTSTKGHIIVLDSGDYSENLSGKTFTLFSGIYSDTGETARFTARVLGYVPADANTVYVDKEGNDSTGDGTSANPVLTIAKAITLCDATHLTVMIQDSGTYIEDGFAFASNFQNLYSALGCQPTLKLSNPDLYVDNFEAITIDCTEDYVNSWAWPYNTMDTKAITLKSGNVILLQSDGSNLEYGIQDKTGGEVLAPTEVYSSAVSSCQMTLLENGNIVFVFRSGANNYYYYTIWSQAGAEIKAVTQLSANTWSGDDYFAVSKLYDEGFVIAYSLVSGANVYGYFQTFNDAGVSQSTVQFQTEDSGQKYNVFALKTTPRFVIVSDQGKYCIYTNAGVEVLALTQFSEDALYDVDKVTGTALGEEDAFILVWQELVGTYADQAYFAVYNSIGTEIKAGDLVYGQGDVAHVGVMATDSDTFVIACIEASDLDKVEFIFYDDEGAYIKTETAMAASPTTDPAIIHSSQDNAIMVYTKKDGSTVAQVNLFSEILWNAMQNGVGTGIVIDGIIFDETGNTGIYALISSSNPLEINQCQFKNINANSPISAGYCIVGELTSCKTSIFNDTDRGLLITGDTFEISDCQFYRILAGYAISADIEDAASDVLIEHNDVFGCYGGIYLVNNDGNEVIKNNIIYSSSIYAINAETEVTFSNSVYTGTLLNAVSGLSNLLANPLYINEGALDPDDTDLHLKLILAGYDFNSPAYGLADDSRNAGSHYIIYYIYSTTWTTIEIEKDIEGVNFRIDPVNPVSNVTKDGSVNSAVEAFTEYLDLSWRAMVLADRLKIETMLKTKVPSVRIYGAPTTAPTEYVAYILQYKSLENNNAHYAFYDKGSKGQKLTFARAFS